MLIPLVSFSASEFRLPDQINSMVSWTSTVFSGTASTNGTSEVMVMTPFVSFTAQTVTMSDSQDIEMGLSWFKNCRRALGQPVLFAGHPH
jgi:hypothetical protein